MQGRFALARVLYQRSYLADLGIHADGGNYERTSAVGDEAAGVDHVFAVGELEVVCKDIGGLIDIERFARKRRLVGLNRCALDKSAVCGNAVARLDKHNIADGYFLRGDYNFFAAAQHLSAGGVELFEVIEAFFRL